MLRLLDGELNVAGNPNEDYARELLELYTIGRTEADVQAAAKITLGPEYR